MPFSFRNKRQSVKPHVLLSALLLYLDHGVALATTATLEPLIWYVSPQGSDAWSGRLSAANTAGTDGPFATPQRARDAGRAWKSERGGRLLQLVFVSLLGGTYQLRQPLRFTPEDSGSAGCTVTYLAFGNGPAVLSGGQSITGWKELL